MHWKLYVVISIFTLMTSNIVYAAETHTDERLIAVMEENNKLLKEQITLQKEILNQQYALQQRQTEYHKEMITQLRALVIK